MRIVLDTNVLVSAIVFGGVPDKIIRRIHKEKHTLLVSPAILKELEKVLRSKIKWENYKINFTLQNLILISENIEPTTRINKIQKDKSDNRILECAIDGKADYLISGDKKHLLPLKKYRRVIIMSPEEFLRQVIYS